jgi:16S rRNA (guanine966-N2)-methyltransferase
MRIIAGRHRGRKIRAPAGLGTRPMLDRVREAMFATLMPWIPEAAVLDLFAGSGSLGLEALSRGARTARLVERHPETLELLRKNVAALGLGAQATVVRGDALSPATWRDGAAADVPSTYDLIFMDPPYALVEEPDSRRTTLATLATLARTHLAADGYVVLHAPRGLLHDDDFATGVTLAQRDYGTNALWYVSRA